MHDPTFVVRTEPTDIALTDEEVEQLVRILPPGSDARKAIDAARLRDRRVRFELDEKRTIAAALSLELISLTPSLIALRHALVDQLHRLDSQV